MSTVLEKTQSLEYRSNFNSKLILLSTIRMTLKFSWCSALAPSMQNNSSTIFPGIFCAEIIFDNKSGSKKVKCQKVKSKVKVKVRDSKTILAYFLLRLLSVHCRILLLLHFYFYFGFTLNLLTLTSYVLLSCLRLL